MSRIVRLSANRRALTAMLEYAREIPTVPVARRMSLPDVVTARGQNSRPPSWSAIFMRAYGITCTHFHQLRRSWLDWPYRRLYEHPTSVCAVAFEREWQGEREVFYHPFREPENQSLHEIHADLVRLQSADILDVGAFRNVLRFGKLPHFLQRLVLRLKLDVSGPRRVKYMGTFGLTNYGMLGAESLHPLGPQTTVMTLSPLSPAGDITVKIVYDHRVLDGGYIARSLSCLEEILHGTILDELKEPIARAA